MEGISAVYGFGGVLHHLDVQVIEGIFHFMVVVVVVAAPVGLYYHTWFFLVFEVKRTRVNAAASLFYSFEPQSFAGLGWVPLPLSFLSRISFCSSLYSALVVS